MRLKVRNLLQKHKNNNYYFNFSFAWTNFASDSAEYAFEKRGLYVLAISKTLLIINTLIKQKITKSMHNELIDKTINNIAKMEP